MALMAPELIEYVEKLADHGDPLLREMEERAARDRFPIIGPARGQFCHLMVRLTGARRVFEMGSGFGYSTVWLARGVAANGGGEVYHTVWDDQLSREARGWIERAGLSSLVRFHVGEAVAALREAEGTFDVIFNDIIKSSYPASLPVVKEKLRPGGLLIIDNMLWHGRILDDGDRSPEADGVREATRMLFSDPDYDASLIPIWDGMIIARKRERGASS